MRDVGVKLRAAVVFADVVLPQSRAALVAVARLQVVLRTALMAVRRESPARHGDKRTVGAADDLQVANHEAMIERDRAERLQALARIFHQLDANLGDFHSCISLSVARAAACLLHAASTRIAPSS